MALISSYRTTSHVLNMKGWPESLRDGVVAGSLSSVLSTAALGICGYMETGSAFAPTNAISHWVWKDEAFRQDLPSVRHTLTGYGIHHGSAIFWGVLYEKWFGQVAVKKSLLPTLASGLAMGGLACFVDYAFTPKRLQPGFEQRLSRRSMAVVYGVFGLGLALRSLLAARRN